MKEGRVITECCVDLARSYVGLAVKAGHPQPDVSDVTAFRAALLNTRSVAYSRIGASGLLFAELIKTMGIADAVSSPRDRLISLSTGHDA